MGLKLVESEQFKAAVGKYPTGITVISTKYNGKPYGFTANSFASVSLEPTLISFCLNVKAGSFEAFTNSKHFVINILSSSQSEIATRFSSHNINKFQNLDYTENEHGAPIIGNVLSFLECEKYDQIEAGDHYIFVGKVLRAVVSSLGTPLVYYAKSYRELK
jgi:flavin reductase (DIM6/NTAB) family NADH-FMN oxidoreductase RutF